MSIHMEYRFIRKTRRRFHNFIYFGIFTLLLLSRGFFFEEIKRNQGKKGELNNQDQLNQNK